MTDSTTDFGVERYLDVRSASGASLAPDGTLAFLLDTTGVPQVWTVDEPMDWPTQHTFGDERATFVEWSPERREFAFGRDEGGNERVQILLGNPSTGETTDLTAAPDAKHRWGGWRPDGERFAFAANRRDESAFDVHVADRDGADERVHETAGWFDVAGWSPDGDRLALVESRSSFDQDVYVLDPETDERRRRTPADVEARYGGVEWGPAGEWLYFVTDRASDTLRLERVPADGGEDGDAANGFEVVVAGGEWEVDGVSVDPETGRIAYSRNVDGYTELTLGRLDGGTVVEATTPDLPGGVAGGVAWDEDGDRAALTATGRTANANVYAVTPGETTRLTDAGTAGIPRDTFVAPELVRYPGAEDLEVPAFFSLPPADTGHGETPVVVDVHGGPESQRRPSFSPVTQYLLAQGYAVFEPNVRGSAGYGREYAALDDVGRRLDAVADLRAGAEWLADHPAVDPDRIAVMGASYGGYMTLAALTEHPDLWAAGVDVVGIANFVTFLENTGDWRQSLREAEYGSLSEDRDLLERISPINRIDRIQAPLFVLHGENDPRVPVDEARQVVAAAREAGVPVRELIFLDEGHGFSKLENRVEAYTAVVEFLDEHV